MQLLIKASNKQEWANYLDVSLSPEASEAKRFLIDRET